MVLLELMPAGQAAAALTGTDDAARKQQGVQGRAQVVQATAAAIDAEQKSTDPLDRRIAQARSTLAQLLAQKARIKPSAPPAAPTAVQTNQAAPSQPAVPAAPQVSA